MNSKLEQALHELQAARETKAHRGTSPTSKRLQTSMRGSTPMVQLEYEHKGIIRRDWVVDHYSAGERMAESQQKARRLQWQQLHRQREALIERILFED